MEMLFKRLQQFPDRHMIIDYKTASLEQLAELIRRYDVGRQLTLASWNRQLLRKMKELVPEIRTKHWLGGSVKDIMDEFHVDQKENFEGITEVQLHLNNLDHAKALGTWRYELPREFAAEALDVTLKAGVLLQVLPWEFEQADIAAILDTGIRSFAVDYPHKFTQSCAVYFGGKWQ